MSSSSLNPEASAWGSWNGTQPQSQPQPQTQTQTQSQQSQTNEGSGRGRRNRAAGGVSTRGRGRGGQRAGNQPNHHVEQQQQQQGPVQPQVDHSQQQQQPRQAVPNSRNLRGSARARGARGRGGRGGASIVPQHTFGSQLSSAEPSATQHTQQQAGSARPTRNRRRNNRGGPADDGASVADTEATAATADTPRLPPSSAADLTTRIHEDIDSGNYDCPICLNAVTRRTRVWSCAMCFHVAHYACVSSWVKKALEQGLALDKIRCPACNSEDTSGNSSWSSFSQKKLCWCGKQKTPGAAPAALPPHSCGRICGRKRQAGAQSTFTCDHTCPNMCHAGPCPPCTEMGPMMACFCGKQTSIKECALSGGAGVSWSCGEPCGQLMPCGEHRCERTCHVDDCGPCKVPMPSTCYCGKVSKELLCRERQAPKTSWSAAAPTPSAFEGTFDCKQACGRAFDCGKHFCSKACHPQDAAAEHCPTSVDVVTHCLCGKTHLALVPGAEERTSCGDPVPSCGKVCSKQLPGCSHACQEPCHDAAKPCPPCKQIIDDVCACEQSKHQVVCGDSDARDAAQCDTVCRASFNCKQHRCANICCSGKPKAARRIAQSKRKANAAANVPLDYEAEHMCVRPCGRMLRCGRHTCPQVCHKGACHSCVAYLHEALSCPCGRTSIEPPYLCGTALPRCDFDCPRPLPCGHPPVPHRCHGTDAAAQGPDGRQGHPCPRCQRLVSKSCLCGKLVLQKVACGADNIQCNSTCGATLKCGVHKCRLGCHAPGRCEDADTEGDTCSQVCGRPKSICGHGCTETCHGAVSKCGETEPCGGAVEIHCSCGRIAKRVRCNAAEPAESAEQSGEEATETEKTEKPRVLECDDECLRIKRNLALRDALRISDDYKDEHMAYSGAQMEYFMANRVFAAAQEMLLRGFAAADDTAAEAKAASLKLKPMKRHERQFVHSLAETLGLRTEARDEEPHRHVIAMRPGEALASTTAATTTVPELTLAESEEIYKRLKERAAEDAALAASEVLKEQAVAAAASARLRGAEKEKQRDEGSTPVSLPPFNAIYVPAAAAAGSSGSPLACDAFQAILEAWQQTLGERAADTAALVEKMVDGDFMLRVDMPDGHQGQLEQFLLFLLSYLVDPSALSSASAQAHLCHVDDQWNVLRRATADAESDAAQAVSQWNIVAGRTDRLERSGVSPATPFTSNAASASASTYASGSSTPTSVPPKRIFTLRKKVVTTVRNSSSSSLSSSSSAAFKSEADRRRWMAILAAQPTDAEEEVEVEVDGPVEAVDVEAVDVEAVDVEAVETEPAAEIVDVTEPVEPVDTDAVDATEPAGEAEPSTSTQV